MIQALLSPYRLRWPLLLLAIFVFVAACRPPAVAPSPVAPTVPPPSPTPPPVTPTVPPPSPTPPPSAPAEEGGLGELSAEQVTTLSSLEQVDAYPLYTMHYHGTYAAMPSSAGVVPGADRTPSPLAAPWACSLFAALADADGMVYGRNFDWEYSPALLLFTDPPDGYASASMVDIAYLGFAGPAGRGLVELPLVEREALLRAPFLPFDGFNERGLAVGMAAVPPGNVAPDPNKETIGSLGVIREMLDHAADVDEAVAILQRYNVDMGGGPPLHYLVADASGRALLVEFYEGELVLLPNEEPWHMATNFLRAAAGESAEGRCGRHDRISQRLAETQGRLSAQEGMDLLADVSQEGTQWSIVYGMSTGEVHVAMGRQYDDVHTLRLELVGGGTQTNADTADLFLLQGGVLWTLRRLASQNRSSNRSPPSIIRLAMVFWKRSPEARWPLNCAGWGWMWSKDQQIFRPRRSRKVISAAESP